MSKANERLKELGFVMVGDDPQIGAWVYMNVEDDHKVEICWDGNDWVIHSKTISTNAGYHDPMGLLLDEVKAFMEKVEELKTIVGDSDQIFDAVQGRVETLQIEKRIHPGFKDSDTVRELFEEVAAKEVGQDAGIKYATVHTEVDPVTEETIVRAKLRVVVDEEG